MNNWFDSWLDTQRVCLSYAQAIFILISALFLGAFFMVLFIWWFVATFDIFAIVASIHRVMRPLL